ncbi:sugar phosphate isomerase/epimerase family protein [Halomonas organivorans]|nr:TIM barrel protein [Halomonas organivorans]
MVTFPKILRTTPEAPAVLVATSAYGQELIAAHGQAAVLPWLAAADADGVEIRRELLPEGFEDYTGLGQACRDNGLGIVYSAADALWADDRLAAGLTQRLEEAERLGAAAIKLSLGQYTGASPATWQRLVKLVAASPVDRVMIENDQTREGGTLAPLAACLEDAEAADCPLAMTFDIGNWHWTGEDPIQAAEHLGRFVAYVHCKGVVQGQGQPHASVPDLCELTDWRVLMAHFPSGVPRAIEYPLQAPDLTAFTREQLHRLRTL